MQLPRTKGEEKKSNKNKKLELEGQARKRKFPLKRMKPTISSNTILNISGLLGVPKLQNLSPAD